MASCRLPLNKVRREICLPTNAIANWQPYLGLRPSAHASAPAPPRGSNLLDAHVSDGVPNRGPAYALRPRRTSRRGTADSHPRGWPTLGIGFRRHSRATDRPQPVSSRRCVVGPGMSTDGWSPPAKTGCLPVTQLERQLRGVEFGGMTVEADPNPPNRRSEFSPDSCHSQGHGRLGRALGLLRKTGVRGGRNGVERQ